VQANAALGSASTLAGLSQVQAAALNNTNDAPLLVAPIADQTATVGSAFTLMVGGVFADLDFGDAVTFAATAAGGSALPSWLSFDAGTLELSGTPDAAGDVVVRITATDSQAATTFDEFAVNVLAATTGINRQGTSAADAVLGSAGADTLTALAANDLLIGLAGNDALDGGEGIDTAVFVFNRSAYNINRSGGTVTVSGLEGTDTLNLLERARFADGWLAFDIDGNAGQTYRLYQAAFARPPDVPGLSFWIGQMDSGATLPAVAAQFIGSAEFISKYGANPSNADFVTLLYQNVLNRLPDAAGLAFWVNQLDAGTISRPEVLIGFSESVENKANVLPAIENGIAYQPTVSTAGTPGADQLVGAAGADNCSALAGRDVLIGLGGDDILDGGEGLDTAGYGGPRGRYSVVAQAGDLLVTDNGSADGIDTLIEVERLQFTDVNLAFDIDGNAGQGYRLYQAAFARTPDRPGLSFWIGALDGGSALLDVAQAFLGSAEFQGLYGANPTDVEFISLLYLNVLNRLPDQSGYDFWLAALGGGGLTRAGVLVEFSESAENQANLIGVLQQGIEYLPEV
jgi:Ca2+-binding RTX toxin-like protein